MIPTLYISNRKVPQAVLQELEAQTGWTWAWQRSTKCYLVATCASATFIVSAGQILQITRQDGILRMQESNQTGVELQSWQDFSVELYALRLLTRGMDVPSKTEMLNRAAHLIQAYRLGRLDPATPWYNLGWLNTLTVKQRLAIMRALVYPLRSLYAYTCKGCTKKTHFTGPSRLCPDCKQGLNAEEIQSNS